MATEKLQTYYVLNELSTKKDKVQAFDDRDAIKENLKKVLPKIEINVPFLTISVCVWIESERKNTYTVILELSKLFSYPSYFKKGIINQSIDNCLITRE